MERRRRSVSGLNATMKFGASAVTHLGIDYDKIPVDVGTSDMGEYFRGVQITDSENHPDWVDYSGRSERDVGGSFTTQRAYMFQPPPYAEFDTYRISTVWPWGQKVHFGSYYWPAYTFLRDSGEIPAVLLDQSSGDTSLNAKGTTAISRVSPTNPLANAGQLLGETAKDGLPSIPLIRSLEKRTKIAKSAGDEFLNHVFGWAPLVADVGSLVSAVEKRQQILAQFERDAGRIVRRRYDFPEEVEESTENLGAVPISPLGKEWWDYWTPRQIVNGNVTKRTKVRRRVWFSGAFTYYLPNYSLDRSQERALVNARQIAGTDLTPSLLWELAPWSWAVDWVSNVGELINNITLFANNGLVLRWGYIMEHCIQDISWEWQVNNRQPDTYVPDGAIGFRLETKKRRPATPYGFGVSLEDLSPFKLSVLTALGLSRSGK